MKGETSSRVIAIVSVIILLVAEAAVADVRPGYIECIDSAECGFSNCCVLGKGRYSIPRCVPLGEISAPCIPRSKPVQNITVSYPDEAMVELTNIYSLMCPCMAGLHCLEETGTCQDPNDAVNFNTI